MNVPEALARTADRRSSTGETHQALHPLLPADGGVLVIPPTRHEEQARLEAEIFPGLGAIGGLSAHPLGIVRLRPEPDRLTIRAAGRPRARTRYNPGQGDSSSRHTVVLHHEPEAVALRDHSSGWCWWRRTTSSSTRWAARSASSARTPLGRPG